MSLASVEQYAAVGVVVLLVGFLAVAMLVVAHTLGPKRSGPVKDSTYESGMPVLQDTRRRFNVRFYIVAVLFLLFDVEIIFLWPWAKVFHHAATTGATIPLDDGTMVSKGFLLAGMGVFFVLLVYGLVYEWRKGAFRWE